MAELDLLNDPSVDWFVMCPRECAGDTWRFTEKGEFQCTSCGHRQGLKWVLGECGHE